MSEGFPNQERDVTLREYVNDTQDGFFEVDPEATPEPAPKKAKS